MFHHTLIECLNIDNIAKIWLESNGMWPEIPVWLWVTLQYIIKKLHVLGIKVFLWHNVLKVLLFFFFFFTFGQPMIVLFLVVLFCLFFLLLSCMDNEHFFSTKKHLFSASMWQNFQNLLTNHKQAHITSWTANKALITPIWTVNCTPHHECPTWKPEPNHYKA